MLIAILLLFAGVDLLINPPKRLNAVALALVFLAAGFFLFAVIFWPLEEFVLLKEKKNLAEFIIELITLKGRLKPYLPLIGGVAVASDLLYNYYFSPQPALMTHDTVAILFGLTLIAYNFVPERFAWERDFVMLFSLFLFLILVLPVLIIRAASLNVDEGVSWYSALFLAPEVAAILSLIGIPTTYDWININFTTSKGLHVTLQITTSCSGIYSLSIFVSAFVAFVFNQFKKVDRRVGLLLLLGVFTAYLANLLRMVVIVVIGYLYDAPEEGMKALLVAHSQAGWIIFLLWIALFWFIVYKFFMKEEERAERTTRQPKGARCIICGSFLSPAIAASRCECGSYYHLDCIEPGSKCPSCSRPLGRADSSVPATAES